MRTRDQVREHFRQIGKPLSQWARENNFPPIAVYRVMGGIDKGNYGRSHDIAVALGLKPDPTKTQA